MNGRRPGRRASSSATRKRRSSRVGAAATASRSAARSGYALRTSASTRRAASLSSRSNARVSAARRASSRRCSGHAVFAAASISRDSGSRSLTMSSASLLSAWPAGLSPWALVVVGREPHRLVDRGGQEAVERRRQAQLHGAQLVHGARWPRGRRPRHLGGQRARLIQLPFPDQQPGAMERERRIRRRGRGHRARRRHQRRFVGVARRQAQHRRDQPRRPLRRLVCAFQRAIAWPSASGDSERSVSIQSVSGSAAPRPRRRVR